MTQWLFVFFLDWLLRLEILIYWNRRMIDCNSSGLDLPRLGLGTKHVDSVVIRAIDVTEILFISDRIFACGACTELAIVKRGVVFSIDLVHLFLRLVLAE
jgi:hypothetical protein